MPHLRSGGGLSFSPGPGCVPRGTGACSAPSPASGAVLATCCGHWKPAPPPPGPRAGGHSLFYQMGWLNPWCRVGSEPAAPCGCPAPSCAPSQVGSDKGQGRRGRRLLRPDPPLCSLQYDQHVISPKEFVHLAGKSTLKDWKRAIRMNGIMLRCAAAGGLHR